jgi:hypothetical protein
VGETPEELRRFAIELRQAAEKRRARIAELEAEVEQLRKEAKASDILAATHEAWARALEEGRLPTAPNSGSLGADMQLLKIKFSRGAAIAKGRIEHPTKFQRALAKRGMSLPEWARARGKKVEKVKTWVKEGEAGRRIPRDEAEAIAKEFPDVPAVDSSWPKGIKD